MGIFSKQSRAKSQLSATTLIAKGSHISGELKVESSIQVDGLVEGELHVDKTLVISEIGVIRGEIFADHLIINGLFEGTGHAGKIEILNKGRVNGTLFSDDLSIEQGGRFTGNTHPSPEHQVVDFKDAKAAAEG
ncbi:polymer-forming cytoskeletal protein [Vibrio mimicus]